PLARRIENNSVGHQESHELLPRPACSERAGVRGPWASTAVACGAENAPSEKMIVTYWEAAPPSPTKPAGLGHPSPAVRERSFHRPRPCHNRAAAANEQTGQ